MITFVDHALAARLEAAEAAHLSATARIVAERLPERGAATLDVGGGVAAFLGRGMSISRAAGLGMSGPVSAAEVDALARFYEERGAEARILVSPFADPSLYAELGARGFVLAKLETLLARRLDLDESLAPSSGVEITVAAPSLAAEWVAASMVGFGMSDAPDARERAALYEAAFSERATTYLFASVGDVVAGTGGLFVQGRCADLFAASTSPLHRGRGVQGALIRARLALAIEQGCDLACAGTEAGSVSQRNFERAGFDRIYSQALLCKPFLGA